MTDQPRLELKGFAQFALIGLGHVKTSFLAQRPCYRYVYDIYNLSVATSHLDPSINLPRLNDDICSGPRGTEKRKWLSKVLLMKL